LIDGLILLVNCFFFGTANFEKLICGVIYQRHIEEINEPIKTIIHFYQGKLRCIGLSGGSGCILYGGHCIKRVSGRGKTGFCFFQ